MSAPPSEIGPTRIMVEGKDPLLGTTLQNKYRIVDYIASGAMGAVYRGVQLSVNREVAVKVLAVPPGVGTPERTAMERRFEREAHLTSQLQHHNSVRLYDYGEVGDGRPYLVMELLRGRTVKALLKAQGKLPPWRAAHILRQVCKALGEAHGMGIVHRDLKPDNIFLIDSGGEPDQVKVVDFGIARWSEPDTDQMSVTRTGLAVGTPRYMAPEQALCEPIKPATDLYSVGIILFELLTGHPPFIADSAIATAMKHVNEPPPPLPRLGLPGEVELAWSALVARLLAKKADDRPGNAASVAAALEHLELRSRDVASRPDTEREIAALLGPVPVAESGSETAAMDAPARPRRRRWGAVAAAAVVVAAGVWLVASQRTDGVVSITPPPPRGDATPAPEGAGDPPLVPRQTAPHAENPNIETAEATRQASDDAAQVDSPATGEVRTPAPESAAGANRGAVQDPHPADAPQEPTTAATESPPSPARLILRSSPSGAVVKRNGERLCETPCDESLSPGPSRVTLSHRGRESISVDLDLAPGSTVSRDVALPAAKTRAVASAKETKTAPGVAPKTEPAGPTLELPKIRTDSTSALPKLRVETAPK